MRRLGLRGIGIVTAILAVVLFAWAWDRSSQPTTGDGWRLLARQRAIGDVRTATTIADAGALEEAWATLRLGGRPVVDFAADAVFWLVPVGTIGCPARLDSVLIDPAARTITGSFSLGLTAGCDTAVVPDSFLIAVDRRRLPAEPFQLRLAGP
jgi:hypothetical protein